MLTKSIFAAAALLAFAVIPAQNAEANSHVNIGSALASALEGFMPPAIMARPTTISPIMA